MATNKQKIIVLIATLLIIGFIVFAINGFSLGGFHFPFSIGGFSTLSLGQVSFSSNDPTIGGQAWLLTVSQNGAGQSATATTSLSDPNSGATSNQFTITTSLDKNYATYNIFNQNVPIYTVTYTSTTYNPFGASGGCNPDVWHNWNKPQGFTVYCWNYNTVGYYGIIGSPNVNFQSTISISGSGGSDSCTVTNIGANSCNSNSGNVQASWVGSLVSGQSTPTPVGLDAIYNTAQGGWITSSQNSYNQWFADNNNLGNCVSNGGGNSCFISYQSATNSVLTSTPFTTTGGNIAVTSGSQSNGQITMNLPTQVQSPVITMRIRASLVGINIPVGKPKITSVSSPVFQTGQSGVIQATVQNIGTSPGSFNVFASCSNGFSQSGNALIISSLALGSSQTVYVPISSNVLSGTQSGTCTVTAKDVNNPSNADTTTVTVSSNALSVCSNGQQIISGNNIQTCQGNVYVTTTTCLGNQTAVFDNNGKPYCSNNSAIGSGGFNLFGTIGKFFNDLFSGVFSIYTIMKWVVVAVVFIFVSLFSKDLISNFKALKRKENIAWILALLLGAGLAYFVFVVFFVGLIVSAIVVVISIVNPFKGLMK